MKRTKNEIPALINRQWLQEWDMVDYQPANNRAKPMPYFYLFSIKAKWLKKLSKVYSRKATKRRIDDTAIQRIHDPKRSEKIRKFIRGGFPWSDLDDGQQKLPEYNDQRMPGWLPTAIVANILKPGTERGNKTIGVDQVIKVRHERDGSASVILPKNFEDANWDPDVPPLEIIDGQHRLWAFEMNDVLDGDYDLPVVAFHGLDIAWQAYLFYTINIKPKKINASLAFDLYPLLRVQEWLEKSPDGSSIYRDTRAQELTEVLWSHDKSPWKDRINMLGEPGQASVTQAAFIRSLTSSFLRITKKKGIGGLFSSPMADNKTILKWNRSQQAAFLILVWQVMADQVRKCKDGWAESLRAVTSQSKGSPSKIDEAFGGKYSLLASDQGVRGYLTIMNDMCYAASNMVDFTTIETEEEVSEEMIENDDVNKALTHFDKQESTEFILRIAKVIKGFDWRTSSFPDLSKKEAVQQSVYRGGSGYKILREKLLRLLAKSNDKTVRIPAKRLIKLG